jgi:hypothetical protein
MDIGSSHASKRCRDIATSKSDQPVATEFVMRVLPASAVLIAAGLLVAAPVSAQTSPDNKPPASAQKQKTQDGNSPTTVGPGSAAYKQKTQDGNSPTMVGPGSGAYKQKTQSMSHSDGSPAATKQN